MSSDPKRQTVLTEKGAEYRKGRLHEVERTWKNLSRKFEVVIESLRKGDHGSDTSFLDLFDQLRQLRIDLFRRASVEIDAVSHDRKASNRWLEFREEADGRHRNREQELREIYLEVVGVELPRSSSPVPPVSDVRAINSGDVVMVDSLLAAANESSSLLTTQADVHTAPNMPVLSSSLADVLETSALPKYYLSQKACEGILRRASKRGKKLPEALEKALVKQVSQSIAQA